ncbi:MAG: RNA polymerase-associated protein RapA [Candidatus Latescibacterota bacterium]|nr:RNA polymerase-associated protein RapA [Candidatus Latescibacterota bacterium]
MNFAPGQRWYSITEPELGLGLVEALEGRQVLVSFPARDLSRRYTIEDPPLVRARLTLGQQARLPEGIAFRIEEVVEAGPLLLYRGEGQELLESDLDSGLDVATPQNRLSSGQVDDYRLFDLRREALRLRHRMLASPARGFLGGRVRFFDHQLAIARDVCERHRVRVLLADEVGLGKTIEALLILHRLLLTGRVENALILVPPSLVHQWLAEAYLRFNLVLRVMGTDTHGGGTIDVESEQLPEQLLQAQLFVCPLVSDTGGFFEQTRWDIVIVDEAHHLQPGSPEYSLVDQLARQTEHVIFASATPDRDGHAAHFHRLSLLDSIRFHDIDEYHRESAHYRELADVAEALAQGQTLSAQGVSLVRQRLDDVEPSALESDRGRREVLRRLLDLHGLGRIMYRNVRSRIPGFPRRRFKLVNLASGDVQALREEFLADLGRPSKFTVAGVETDPRTIWLRGFLQGHSAEKVLVLCGTRAKAEAFALALSSKGQRKVARFHEEMGVVERDRQAAWFLDSEGPQVVVSSAIGAEGRNFQVARHLVLLDLPVHADRLEQAIGRLDRIGQGSEIHIHVPTLPGTPQARLRRWHAEVLGIFERPWYGAATLEREFGEELIEALLVDDDETMESLLRRAARRNEEIVAELETGRDRLLELTSFDGAAAQRLREVIDAVEANDDLESYMIDAFERCGLETEWLGQRSYSVRPGIEYHRPFPGFFGEEMAVTFDRQTALDHPDRALLSWDHPMVRDCIDSMLDNEVGNATVARLPKAEPGVLLEALYIAESITPKRLRADRFLPPTPIPIVVDMTGSLAEVEGDTLRNQLRPVDPGILEIPQVSAMISELVQASLALAEERSPAIVQAAMSHMRSELEPELQRLEDMARVNSSIRAEEIATARIELADLSEGLSAIRLRLDGLRFILCGSESPL